MLRRNIGRSAWVNSDIIMDYSMGVITNKSIMFGGYIKDDNLCRVVMNIMDIVKCGKTD